MKLKCLFLFGKILCTLIFYKCSIHQNLTDCKKRQLFDTHELSYRFTIIKFWIHYFNIVDKLSKKLSSRDVKKVLIYIIQPLYKLCGLTNLFDNISLVALSKYSILLNSQFAHLINQMHCTIPMLSANICVVLLNRVKHIEILEYKCYAASRMQYAACGMQLGSF